MSVASLPVTEFTSGALLVFFLQQLKRVGWIHTVGTWIYTAISAVWALVSTILVSWEWTTNAAGQHTLTLVWPTLGAGLLALWHFIEQFAIQETIYQGTAGKKP